MPYDGSCHCGAVAFTVDAPTPQQAISCNCSHCRRKGYLLSFVPEQAFRLRSGEEQLHTYTFNKHRIQHKFCATCGAAPFAYGSSPDGQEMRAINLRCVPDIDLAALNLQHVDGASA